MRKQKIHAMYRKRPPHRERYAIETDGEIRFLDTEELVPDRRQLEEYTGPLGHLCQTDAGLAAFAILIGRYRLDRPMFGRIYKVTG
jgi:hypothetical protein